MKVNPARSLIVFAAVVAIVCISPRSARAQYTVTPLSIAPGIAFNEYNVNTPLMMASDGNFYGFENTSGSSSGSLFRATLDGTITNLFSFPDATSGAALPIGNLVEAPDGYIYGATIQGGANGAGILFKIKMDGSGFTDVYDVPATSRTSGYVSGGLTLGADGNLYGVMNGVSLSYGDVARPSPVRLKASGVQVDRSPTVQQPAHAPGRPQPQVASPTCSVGYEGVFFQYNVTTGVVTPLNCSVPLGGVAGSLVQGANGKFYAVDGPYGEVIDVVEIDSSGNETDYDVSGAQSFIYGSMVAGLGNQFYWVGHEQSVAADFLISADPTNSFATTEIANLTGSCGSNAYGNGTMYSAGDGNLYIPYSNNDGGIMEFDNTGAVTCIADPYFSADVALPTSAPIEGTDGNFYGMTAGCECGVPEYYQMTGPSPLPAQVAMVSLQGGQVPVGQPFTLLWAVPTAATFAPPVCEEFVAGASNPGSPIFGIVLAGGAVNYPIGQWGGSIGITPPSIGDYIYQVECPGVGAASLPISVRYGTAVTLAASSNSVIVGQPDTFTATVSTSTGPTAPTGTVTFTASNGVQATATLAASGATTSTASITINTAGLPAGSYTVGAQYNGDGVNAAATATPASVAVALNPTTTTFTSSTSTAAIGQSVTLTATVSGAAPSGSFTFYAGGNPIGTAPISTGTLYAGSATLVLQTGTLPAGTFAVTAHYNGDSFNAASSSNTTSITLTGFSTGTTLSASSQSVQQGTTVTVVANVSNAATTPPSGTVTFYAGPAVLGTQTLSPAGAGISTASLAINTGSIAGGTYAVTARYSGDSQNTASTAAAVNLTVTLPTYTLAITYLQDTEDYGNPNGTVGDFSAANVNVNVTGSSTPTGTVTVRCAGAVIGTYNVSPVTGGGFVYFHINEVETAAGTCPMVATYNGDATHGVSSSPPFTVTILPASVSLAVIADTNVHQGQGLQLSTLVNTYGWNPTGSVTFFVNGNVPLCTGAIDQQTLIASCSITVPSQANIRGYSVTAYYPGDLAHAADTSPAVTIGVIAQ